MNELTTEEIEQETQEGFKSPDITEFEVSETDDASDDPVTSELSEENALTEIQLLKLSDNEGSLLFYPSREGADFGVNLEVGDVLFLREKQSETEEENGLIVQVISKETASYPHADTKAIFRLMVRVKAFEHQRFNEEPKEVIDEFLVANFKVRASVKDGEWGQSAGKVVTRNVDIFPLSEDKLAKQIFKTVPNHNINLGNYKTADVNFFGGGFEKINLITGMKGGGKSHIAKGIISESLNAGMSAIVFDINNEYEGLNNTKNYVLGQNISDGRNTGLNLKFRLDRIPSGTFISLVERVAPFAERTAINARAQIPAIIRQRIATGNPIDIDFLISQANAVFPGNATFLQNMRDSYTASLEMSKVYNLIMTANEIQAEDAYLKKREKGEHASIPDVISLRTALYNLESSESEGGREPGVVVFKIGGLQSFIQYTIVDLVIETLKDICNRQTQKHKQEPSHVPMYPTVYFEEAHMYMEMQKINELLPLIRHFGMNVFFMTNTPGALPDSVFRLIDNLIMTRILNKKDIDQVKNCGLTDADTIEGFAKSLDKYYALLLSAQDGATKNFPLVFKVRDFGLPKSGETRSMWKVLKDNAEQTNEQQNQESEELNGQSEENQ